MTHAHTLSVHRTPALDLLTRLQRFAATHGEPIPSREPGEGRHRKEVVVAIDREIVRESVSLPWVDDTPTQEIEPWWRPDAGELPDDRDPIRAPLAWLLLVLAGALIPLLFALTAELSQVGSAVTPPMPEVSTESPASWLPPGGAR